MQHVFSFTTIARRAALATLAGIAWCLAPAAVGAADASPPRFPAVTTIAGDGAAGVVDGVATTSRFMMPTSVAQDSDGTIYVADAMAERIRAISPAGVVRTIAGGGDPDRYLGLFVQGGYNDGEASLAHFYVPVAVAVDGRHRVFVADSHCIRMIASGTVTTYAGACTEGGDRLGAARDARFTKPVSIAIDRAGDLFVADELNGIREIAPDGRVAKVDMAVHRPSAISLWEAPEGMSIAVADVDGIVMREPNRADTRIPLRNTDTNPFLQAGAPLGYPFGIVLTGPASAVYTDVRTHTIRYVDNHTTRVLAGDAYDDVENEGGGYRDGSGTQALFDGPMGIARARDGGFIVADAGNRRIRRVSAFDARTYASPIDLGTPFPQVDASTYNVLLVGNSFAWFDTDWQTSVAGRLEEKLDAAGIGRPVRVIALPAMTLPATESYFREAIGYEPIDLVVMLVNSSTIQQAYPVETFATSAYVQPMTQQMRAIRAALPKAKFLVALHPYPWQYSTTESIYHRFYDLPTEEWLNISPSFHEPLLKVARGANLDTIDLWPVFAKAEAGDHVPLFGTVTYHFTPAGRALAADAIANHLTAEAPWKK